MRRTLSQRNECDWLGDESVDKSIEIVKCRCGVFYDRLREAIEVEGFLNRNATTAMALAMPRMIPPMVP
jgi:hypothetical protein